MKLISQDESSRKSFVHKEIHTNNILKQNRKTGLAFDLCVVYSDSRKPSNYDDAGLNNLSTSKCSASTSQSDSCIKKS